MFDGIAPSHDQSGVPFFGTIAGGLVDLLAPRPGERVLDVGAGRGAVTLHPGGVRRRHRRQHPLHARGRAEP